MTGFIKPMLATATAVLPSGTWIAEEKLDGHRLIVARTETDVRAWSRTGKQRAITTRMLHTLEMLPPGVYDGELIVPHGYSSSVTDLANASFLQYVVFDLLSTKGRDTTFASWKVRRDLLEEIFERWEDNSVVTLTEFSEVRTWQDVEDMVDEIWKRGGEGVILKDTNAPYRPGKRTKTFLKVKQLQSAVLEIIGFARSEGEIMQYGDFGTAVLEDEQGVIIPVKVLDDATRARLVAADSGARRWQIVRTVGKTKVEMHTEHPWVGRRLHIEFQQRTPDGSYRHPRWDRLDGE